MPPLRPSTEEEFVAWAESALGADFGDATRRHYDLNSSRALLAVQRHPFFAGLSAHLVALNEQVRSSHHTQLLMSSPDVTLHIKPYASVVNKAFRLNVVWNRRFPEPPNGGWLMPDTIATRCDDLIRTTIVTKFIDQPRKLAEHLQVYATSLGLESHFSSKDQEEGYYAYHFYVGIPLTWVDRTFNEVSVNLDVEVQLSTQLQEILYAITHEFYEERRVAQGVDRHAWKWEVRSNRFRAAYVSHTLHLLEAIILELRDSRRAITAIAPAPPDQTAANPSDPNG